jgi:hypothetical protein
MRGPIESQRPLAWSFRYAALVSIKVLPLCRMSVPA